MPNARGSRYGRIMTLACVLSKRISVLVSLVGMLPCFGCASSGSDPADEGELGRVAQAASRKTAKVAICHIPPDDPTGRQTILVSESAVSAHLEHGDVLDECPSGCTANEVCDDGDLCTSDACMPDGTCSHVSVSCDDGNPCTVDSCAAVGGCLNAPGDGVACVDGNDCTTADTCLAGQCVGTAIAGCCTADAGCNDENACTVDHCVAGRCTNEQANCAVSDRCLAGFCDPATGACASTPVSCDDSDPCTVDSCDPALGCVSTPATDFTSCNDGNLCTTGDQCLSGVCVGNPRSCNGGSVCRPGVCNPQSGTCSYDAEPDGTVCQTYAPGELPFPFTNAEPYSVLCTAGTCGETTCFCPAPNIFSGGCLVPEICATL